MKNPKYKIGQEVYRVNLDKAKMACIIAHKISQIGMSEEGITYTMFVYGYSYGEDFSEQHEHKEDELFETKEEAMDAWEEKSTLHQMDRIKAEISHLKNQLGYDDQSIERARKTKETREKDIAKKRKELEALSK